MEGPPDDVTMISLASDADAQVKRVRAAATRCGLSIDG